MWASALPLVRPSPPFLGVGKVGKQDLPLVIRPHAQTAIPYAAVRPLRMHHPPWVLAGVWSGGFTPRPGDAAPMPGGPPLF